MKKLLFVSIATASLLSFSVQANELSDYQRAKEALQTAIEFGDYSQADRDFCFQTAGDNSSVSICAWEASKADIANFITEYDETKDIIRAHFGAGDEAHRKQVALLHSLRAAVKAYSELATARCAVETNQWWGGSGAGAANAGCISRMAKAGAATLKYIDAILGDNNEFLAEREREKSEFQSLEELSLELNGSADGLSGTLEVAAFEVDENFSHLEESTRDVIKADLFASQTNFIDFRDKFCAIRTSLLYPTPTVTNAIEMSKAITFCAIEQNRAQTQFLEGQDQ